MIEFLARYRTQFRYFALFCLLVGIGGRVWTFLQDEESVDKEFAASLIQVKKDFFQNFEADKALQLIEKLKIQTASKAKHLELIYIETQLKSLMQAPDTFQILDKGLALLSSSQELDLLNNYLLLAIDTQIQMGSPNPLLLKQYFEQIQKYIKGEKKLELDLKSRQLIWSLHKQDRTKAKELSLELESMLEKQELSISPRSKTYALWALTRYNIQNSQLNKAQKLSKELQTSFKSSIRKSYWKAETFALESRMQEEAFGFEKACSSYEKAEKAFAQLKMLAQSEYYRLRQQENCNKEKST